MMSPLQVTKRESSASPEVITPDRHKSHQRSHLHLNDVDASASTKASSESLGDLFFDDFDPSSLHTKKRKLTPLVSYEVAVWTIFVLITALAIVDRFTTNVWPRQSFSIGGRSAGNDRLVGFKPGPWSVVAYDVIARVSGRFSICCFNLLLITRLRFLEHVLSRSSRVNRIVDCTDIIHANLRLHRWNAVALCALTFVHVWSILLPCVAHGYSAQVVPGRFEYPLSERAPKGFKDADPATQTMSLQVDDVWRMVQMTLLLCVATPLSVRWLSARWHVGMPLHRLVMILYFVDIVRRHSHPHSWVLNAPVFCVWVLDKVGCWYWHRSVSPKVHRVKLDQDYMVLYWNHQQTSHSNAIVGPDYFLRLNDSSLLEGAHVFTTFENRRGVRLDGDPSFKWTVGTVIRVFREKRTPRMGAKDATSHTSRMFDAKELDVTTWGPYHGEMSARLRRALLDDSDRPVVLIAAGSGVGFFVDVLQWATEFAPERRLKALFTTRSEDLFEWARRTLEPFASEKRRVDVALTGHSGENSPALADTFVEDNGRSPVSAQYGRFDFRRAIGAGSVVFCQGGQGIKDHVAAACRFNGSMFFGGLGGS